MHVGTTLETLVYLIILLMTVNRLMVVVLSWKYKDYLRVFHDVFHYPASSVLSEIYYHHTPGLCDNLLEV